MNKIYLSVGIVLFTLCVITVLMTRQQESPAKHEKQPTANQVASHSQSEDTEARPARRRSNTRTQNTTTDDVSASSVEQWVFEDPLSSTVTAVIHAGESLVTGGYKTANGKYEMTIITPRSVRMEDGREMIEIRSKGKNSRTSEGEMKRFCLMSVPFLPVAFPHVLSSRAG